MEPRIYTTEHMHFNLAKTLDNSSIVPEGVAYYEKDIKLMNRRFEETGRGQVAIAMTTGELNLHGVCSKKANSLTARLLATQENVFQELVNVGRKNIVTSQQLREITKELHPETVRNHIETFSRNIANSYLRRNGHFRPDPYALQHTLSTEEGVVYRQWYDPNFNKISEAEARTLIGHTGINITYPT